MESGISCCSWRLASLVVAPANAGSGFRRHCHSRTGREFHARGRTTPRGARVARQDRGCGIQEGWLPRDESGKTPVSIGRNAAQGLSPCGLRRLRTAVRAALGNVYVEPRVPVQLFLLLSLIHISEPTRLLSIS